MTYGVLPRVETRSWLSGSSRRGRPVCPFCHGFRPEPSSRGTGCPTSARARFAMNRAVRTTEPMGVPPVRAKPSVGKDGGG
jgi:hypothetical protein